MQETQAPSQGREDPLEKGMATRSNVLAWEIPWVEDPWLVRGVTEESETTSRLKRQHRLYLYIFVCVSLSSQPHQAGSTVRAELSVMTVVSPAPAAGQVLINMEWEGPESMQGKQCQQRGGDTPHGSVGENGNYGRRVAGGEAEAGWVRHREPLRPVLVLMLSPIKCGRCGGPRLGRRIMRSGLGL